MGAPRSPATRGSHQASIRRCVWLKSLAAATDATLGCAVRVGSRLVQRRRESANSMSPQTRQTDVNDIRPDYDFSRGRRGVHHAAYSAGTNVVFLEPDLVEAFPDSESVNQALRLLVRLSHTQAVSGAKSRKTASRSRKRAKSRTKPGARRD